MAAAVRRANDRVQDDVFNEATAYPAGHAVTGRVAPPGAQACDAEQDVRNERLLRTVLRLVNAGYLSKANAAFTTNPCADLSVPENRDCLHGLHPSGSELDDSDMADAPAAPEPYEAPLRGLPGGAWAQEPQGAS